ncbi:tetratricopeptide repeat protein [Endozoicomonas ascidiicola]|uniref:tetratricopeptide repeat protein n=1 Tax=Endozoicomonas ascidiicola TaxID=1698521 RepID=UPI00082BF0FB|nr:tetratricopeptide repeat protein [Endozoicomonas ascidiicola]
MALMPVVEKVMPKAGLTIILLTVLLVGCSTSMKMPENASVQTSPYVERDDAVGSLLNLAWNARKQGQLDAAESYLNRAVRISPTTPDVYYQLALLRQDQGKPEQSKQLAERALSLQPGPALVRKINQLFQELKS